MTSLTIRLFNQLNGDFWLQSVGQPDLHDVFQVSSWLHAVAQCAGVQWENTQLEGMNMIGDKVQTRSKERYQLWNLLVKEANAAIEPLVMQRVDPVLQREKLPPAVRASLFRDLRGLFLECEYGDVASPGLFTGLADVYRSGHFPCDWQGEYPKGRLIIF